MFTAKLGAKGTIVMATIMCAVFISPFGYTTNYWVLWGVRVVTGVFLAFFKIYFPIWIDECAPK